MIMSMCKIICVTNRLLAGENFFGQIEKIAAAGADEVILREKDLTEPDYEHLAKRAADVCEKYQVPLTVHSFVNVSQRLAIGRIHLPMGTFLNLKEQEKEGFDKIGVSVHSVQEALEAAELGASYLTAGHVFATDCKKGMEPRGLSFLENVCRTVDIPVYAIGGIGPENAKSCIKAGAAGLCLMSSFMKIKNPEKLMRKLRENMNL